MLTKEHIKTLEGLHSLAVSRGDIAAAEALTAALETVRALPETRDGYRIIPYISEVFHPDVQGGRRPGVCKSDEYDLDLCEFDTTGADDWVWYPAAECYAVSANAIAALCGAAAALQEQQQ